jgi:hypothetical protein
VCVRERERELFSDSEVNFLWWQDSMIILRVINVTEWC